ncbi:MAG: class I SAM-dependent methyltransferase [Hyphomicrobiaceae bacterium]
MRPLSTSSETNPKEAPVTIEKIGGRIVGIGHIDESKVKVAYRRWAPVYDSTFGRIANDGRQQAVELINQRSGSVLEVGVGTGLSLPNYKSNLEITGIDLSAEMLDKARERVSESNLTNIKALLEMDAGELEFPDNSFDVVTAMFVMTVVPDPEKVMRELARVTKPGGEVLVVNHFSQEQGVRGWFERRMAPLAEHIGWRPVFDVGRVLVCEDLELQESNSLRPFGLFTLMRFIKSVDADIKMEAAE